MIMQEYKNVVFLLYSLVIPAMFLEMIVFTTFLMITNKGGGLTKSVFLPSTSPLTSLSTDLQHWFLF